MGYYVEFGQYTNAKRLYIITNDDLTSLTFTPTEVKGSVEMCTLLINPDSEVTETPIIKQSLVVNLIRENLTDFQDIILGDDERTYGIVVDNGTISKDGTDLVLSAGARLDFIGNLTIETYGEAYLPVPEVSLTFHDRIGVLGDSMFLPTKTRLTIPELFADLVPDIITSDYILLEWPYSTGAFQKPNDFSLDVSGFVGQTKYEVLKQFLNDFGLQLLCDFSTIISSDSTPNIFDCGCIRVRTYTNAAESTYNYYILEKSEIVSGDTTYYSYSVKSTGGIVVPEVKSKFTIQVYEGDEEFSFTLTIGGQSYTIYCYFEANIPSLPWPANTVYLELEASGTIRGSLSAATMRDYIPQLVNYSSLSTNQYVIFEAIDGGSPYDVTFSNLTLSYRANLIALNYQTGSSSPSNSLYTETKTRIVMDTSMYPLINREGRFDLQRRVKKVVAKHQLEISDNLVFKGVIDSELVTNTQSDDSDYSPYPYAFDFAFNNSVISRENAIKNYVKGLHPKSDINYSNCGKYDNEDCIVIKKKSGDTRYISTFNPIYLYGNSLTTTITADAAVDGGEVNALYVLPIALIDGVVYVYYTTGWAALTTLSYANALYIYSINNDRNYNTLSSTIPFTDSIFSGKDYQVYIIMYGETATEGLDINNWYLKSINITVKVLETYPNNITLYTNINSLNRKNKEITTKFGCVPNITGIQFMYRHILFDADGKPLTSILFKELDQTLLAHLSDQIGLVYGSERWIFEGNLKGNNLRLFDIYELESRAFIPLKAEYDLVRGFFKGKWFEVYFVEYADNWLFGDNDEILYGNNENVV